MLDNVAKLKREYCQQSRCALKIPWPAPFSNVAEVFFDRRTVFSSNPGHLRRADCCYVIKALHHGRDLVDYDFSQLIWLLSVRSDRKHHFRKLSLSHKTHLPYWNALPHLVLPHSYITPHVRH